MKNLLILIICLLAMPVLHAQSDVKSTFDPGPDEQGVWRKVDEMPRFPGCEDLVDAAKKPGCSTKELFEFVSKDLLYPAEARLNGIEGKAVVTFVIEVDGYPNEAKVVRSLGYGIDEEMLRIVERMQDANILWIPGKQEGKPVRTRFILPMSFKME